ncbi:glycosyltransferase 87 family protein [Streptomyces sp. NPDC046261]|uniref:glycosyltransferase 87 family protein n=1 Tax=Streptomyces sp. NPDC046261 TaxID=3157200 RepID=UPI0033D61757
MGTAAAWCHRTGQWLTSHAGWCLTVSVGLHVLAVSVFIPETVDLRVYRDASPLVISGGLYDYRLLADPPNSFLPFTYPPFAALVFLPLSRLPWTVAVCLWQAASVAALFVISRCAGRLMSPGTGRGGKSHAMLWTAAGLWLEPARHTLDQGQVNLLLGALVLGALTVLRTAVGRGTAVGLAAAVKLTPGIGGLYFLATRQWRAAAWALTTACTATALAWQAAPRESARYWSALVTNTHRMGPLWSVRNQSLRGALSRLLGHDAGLSMIWWTTLALVTVLAAYALWNAMRRHDLLGILITAELYGLLVSPISWSHHWIWCLPTMIWLAHNTRRRKPLIRVTLAAWTLATATRLVPLLTRLEDNLPSAHRYPALLAWPASAYAACALLSFLAISTDRAPAAHHEDGYRTGRPQTAGDITT